MTQAEYNAAFDEGFEIGEALCETHHNEITQSERKRVLDKILNHILDDMGVEIHERDGKKYFVISGTFSVSELILYLQSLRQSKEGEL
jgi:hypothetical protein